MVRILKKGMDSILLIFFLTGFTGFSGYFFPGFPACPAKAFNKRDGRNESLETPIAFGDIKNFALKLVYKYGGALNQKRLNKLFL
jgi:hypothetical protein